MNLELSKDDLMLLQVLLSKEEAETRVEMHHSRTHDYKDFLRDRQMQIANLLERLGKVLGSNE